MKKMGKEQFDPREPVVSWVDTMITILSYVSYLKYVAIAFVLIDNVVLGIILLVAGYFVKLLASKVCNKRSAKVIAKLSE